MADNEDVDLYPDVPEWQRLIVERYRGVLHSVGAHDPLYLLQIAQRPSMPDRPGVRETNPVIAGIAMSVVSQVALLQMLEQEGILHVDQAPADPLDYGVTEGEQSVIEYFDPPLPAPIEEPTDG